ncbi:MAG: hypothetical protein LBQ12_08445, partial [Deltaproteobacteria bacterium]|nr:hypothetical protein [Deltaproteobacteria bacterium]
RRDFDRELHRHYEFLKSSGQPGRFGLKRVRMNNDETGVIGKGADDAYALSAPGWVVRVREGDSGRANSYKYYFNFRDQAETEIMNKAIANTAVANLGLRMLTEANRLHSSFLTRYNASFSPGAMVKDLIERFFNQYSRDRFVRADGSSVSGVEVARRMASLAVNPEFYSAYFKAFVKGEESDTPFGKLVAEFRRSGANFNQLSLIKSLGIETTSANVKAQLLERKRLKIAWNKFAGSTPVKAVNKVFDGWNDGFNGFAPALQFAAMRLSGMTFKDSAADTLDMMNYYKTGEMDSMGSAFFVFYRPIVQGGANFLRSISPFGKGDDAAKWRGAVTFAVLVTMGILAQGLLRSLGDIDDETGINSYDALPFETVSRSMAITLPGGGIFKAPIGFGGPQAAFGMGAAIHRMGLGLLTPRQALSHSAVAFMKQVAPDVYPGYAVSDNPFAFGAQTFVPQIFRPVIDLAVNKNYFGGPIKRGAATVGIREYDKGKLATAPGWHEFARTAFETTNLDFTPEQWRYLLTSYLWGPLAAFTSSYDEDKLLPNEYGSGATNRIFSAFGLNAFYKPETDSALNYIYLVKERFEQDFLRTGTRISRTGESSTHDEKIDLIRDNMKEAGYSADEIKGYLFVAEFDKEKDGISRDFSQLASKYKYGDIEVEGSVQRKFQKFADAQAKLIERTGEKLWALDLLRDGVGKGARKPEKDK